MGGVQLFYSLDRIDQLIFPPGSKYEALRLGVHSILLYYIRILLLIPKIFVLFSGRWTFLFFKSLDNNMMYTLDMVEHI